ncbi:MAG: xylulokinase [Anaerolineae bacterium]|nr:xylulokinase [Anaerolineae bacterium]
MSYLLGIDVGTSGAKALLIDAEGAVIASATEEYPLHTPRPLWAEQDPEDWWRATVAAIRAVLNQSGVHAEDVAGLGLTGQMHGMVALDADGQVLRPCIMWNDQRTALQCAEIMDTVGRERFLALTGNLALPGFTAPKILWVRQNEPEVYRRIAQVLLPKDYIRYRLTGDYATEVSDASGTVLFDVAHRRWSLEVLEALDIPPSWMPNSYESPEVTGTVSETAARETGLRPGLPVAGGGGDQAAQAVGSGIVREGIISVTVGTSGVVFAATDDMKLDPQARLHSFCHAVPGRWHVMGVMLSAGGSLRWLRDTIAGPEREVGRLSGVDPYEIMIAEAAQVPAGSEGLLFLPYLTGERTPYADPNARGAFVGLTLRHGKGAMVRAVLEGVAYGLRDSLELLRALHIPIQQVRASGGGARSTLWRQIMANIFGTELVTINITEGAAYGAALLAGVGAGVYRDVFEATERTIRVVDRVEPVADEVAIYDGYYQDYRALYGQLKPTFDSVAKRV